jgi:hypothetical protein
MLFPEAELLVNRWVEARRKRKIARAIRSLSPHRPFIAIGPITFHSQERTALLLPKRGIEALAAVSLSLPGQSRVNHQLI